jgi:hypothetical protein
LADASTRTFFGGASARAADASAGIIAFWSGSGFG